MRKQNLVDRIETRGRRGNIGLVGAALLEAARVAQPVPEAQITVSYERVQRKVEAMDACDIGAFALGIDLGAYLKAAE